MADKNWREFWIIDETPYSTWVSSKPLNSADTKEEIHVIELAALLAAQKEISELKASNENLRALLEATNDDNVARLEKVSSMLAERDSLRTQLASLEKSVKQYSESLFIEQSKLAEAIEHANELRSLKNKLAKQLAAAKEALEFYANERNYSDKCEPEHYKFFGRFDEDPTYIENGKRARQTLEKLKPNAESGGE